MIDTKRNRKYNLPKYICYDMAESRNREYNVFQIQLHFNDKLVKTYKRTVKDSVIFVVSKMLENNTWTLAQAAEYMLTYTPDMENGNFVMSNTPKSPCWRKREKAKNLKKVKVDIMNRLGEVLKFAKDNDIEVEVNIR